MKEFIESHVTIDRRPLKLQTQYIEILDYIEKNLQSKDLKPIIINKSRQVGASSFARALSLAMAFEISNTKIIHGFPTLSQATQSGKSLNNIILDAPRGTTKRRNGTLKSCIEERIVWGDKTNTNLMKVFDNKSSIMTDSVGVNASRLRGVSADGIIIDEAHCVSAEAMHCAAQLTTQSRLGCPGQGFQLFLITPNKKESIAKKTWESSTQDEWHYECPDCKNLFPININNWEDVWVQSFELKCDNCNCCFDKRKSNGKWISKQKSTVKGFHIHQPLINIFTKECIYSLKNYAFMTDTIFKNEVFGEF